MSAAAAKALYARTLKELRREYAGIVLKVARIGDRIALEDWADLRHALEQSLQMADIVSASSLHWRATHEQTIVPDTPGVTIRDVVLENAWLQNHVSRMDPIIQQISGRVAAIERDYYLRRWSQGKLNQADILKQIESGKHPLWRLEMFYRTTLGDVAETSQQLELSKPHVGINFPFAAYHSRDDAVVRPTHHAMDGFVAHRSWDGWSRARPKCGFNCRCKLRYYSTMEAKRMGWMDQSGKPKFIVRWPNAEARANWEGGKFPDKGWWGPKYVAPSFADMDVAA